MHKEPEQIDTELDERRAIAFHVTSLMRMLHEVNKANGHWESDSGIPTDCTKIALLHSTASRALESLRRGNPKDQRLPKYTEAEVHLADGIIRALDLAARRDWDLAGAILAKVMYNETHGKPGKAF